MTGTIAAFYVFIYIIYLVSGPGVQANGETNGTANGDNGDSDDNVPASIYSIEIEVDGELLVKLYRTDLYALPTQTFVDDLDLHIQDGPAFSDVLELVGIDDYETVTFTGIERMQDHMGPPAELTLGKAEVDSQLVLLDKTEQGKFKLAATDIPKDDWIINITEISFSTT